MRKNILIVAAFVLGMILAELPGHITAGGQYSVATDGPSISHVALASVAPTQEKSS